MAKERYTTGEVIDALEDARGVKAHAARILKCERHTVDNYIDRHPTVARAYQNLRETMVDMAEHRLMLRLNAGDWAAVKYVLSTLGRRRGYVTGHDVTSDDKPIAGGFAIIEVPMDDDDDDDKGPL